MKPTTSLPHHFTPPPLHFHFTSPPLHSLHFAPLLFTLMSLSFDEVDLLTEESWGIMGIYGSYVSSTETQLKTTLKPMPMPNIPVKEPRFKSKSKKTKKPTKPTKKRIEFLRNKGSRWYNKGRFVSIE